MNSTNPTAPQNLPPLNSLIKPEQVTKLPHFPEAQKAKYFGGISKLWETIRNNTPDSQEYQQAYQKLVDVSMSIKSSIQKQKEQGGGQPAVAAQANGGRPNSSSQPGQTGLQGPQENRSQAPLARPSGAPNVPETFTPKVMEKARELKVFVPPNIFNSHGPDGAQRYVQEAKRKYAQSLSRLEQSSYKLEELKKMTMERTASGRPFNPQELENFQGQEARLVKTKEESMEYLRSFQRQQEALKAQLEQGRSANAGNTGNDPSRDPNTQGAKQEGNQSMGGVLQPPEHQGQAHTVSSALDAARNQANLAGRPSQLSPPNQGQPTHLPMNQPTNSHPPMANQLSNPHPHINMKPESRPQDQHYNSPHMPPAQPAPHNEPRALTHSDAVEQARSHYPNAGFQHSTPQSAGHGHPHQHNQREGQQNNHTKMPIPKDFNLPPPQPVSMGQSRPTLTNGPMAMGPLGQPAITRAPGYLLEGDGERVLSRKKLEELVRQVTGGTGGEGEEGESLTADVEEVNLSRMHTLRIYH